MQKILTLGTVMACLLFFQHQTTSAQGKGSEKNYEVKARKGPKNEHHGKKSRGDWHEGSEYNNIKTPAGSGSPEVVNKGPKPYYHGVKDRGHQHHYDQSNYEKVYKYTYRYRGGGMPAWAKMQQYRGKHYAYFPDYFTFFDPANNNYVFWNGNVWTSSDTIPDFLFDVDLSSARLVEMTNVSTRKAPYLYFDDYYRAYPPEFHKPGVVRPPLMKN
jgi:hypothetical protein